MEANRYFEEFGKPFAPEDVCWRLQTLTKDKAKGAAVPYLDARAIADRLDAVVGQFRWQDKYSSWHEGDKGSKQSQLCTIYIYDEELKDWVGKTDGAPDTDVEPVKGGLSDAFKRAAVRWNIGRYLYRFDVVWVKTEQRGSGYIIEQSENTRLEKIYRAKVMELFGYVPEHQKPATPQPSNAKSQSAPVYEIKKLKVQEGAKGQSSALVMENGGKKYQAYISGKDDRLKVGSKITNVKTEKISNSYGTYRLIQSYDVAA